MSTQTLLCSLRTCRSSILCGWLMHRRRGCIEWHHQNSPEFCSYSGTSQGFCIRFVTRLLFAMTPFSRARLGVWLCGSLQMINFFKLVDVQFASQVWHQPIWKLPIPSPTGIYLLSTLQPRPLSSNYNIGSWPETKVAPILPSMPPMSLAIGFWGPTIVNSTGAKLILM